MSKQIRSGMKVTIGGMAHTVVRREKGRAGEGRYVYVVRRDHDGHAETRSRETVLRGI